MIVKKTYNSRFKKCLNCGMKVSWVLSDEERNRSYDFLFTYADKISIRLNSANVLTAEDES